ncbi:hypothetical protein EC9_18280 [Rosistilla ulvae]|uniref:Uncharacterized protein n=1 Tax=Rosistilla ulvae TaxID=1930277 RepID=A0A517LYG5_9BACT|nr:hypothetical protein EC9_18280 [Rosistilla ulvae]
MPIGGPNCSTNGLIRRDIDAARQKQPNKTVGRSRAFQSPESLQRGGNSCAKEPIWPSQRRRDMHNFYE